MKIKWVGILFILFNLYSMCQAQEQTSIYWTKYSDVYEGTLAPDMIQSVYDYDWSKYRLLEFYYPCREPNEAQWQEAKKLVANSPLWPEEGSVVKGDGFIAVALSRP